PPLCIGCRVPVGAPYMLCGECWRGLAFIAPPFCRRCGIPFALEYEAELACDACLSHDPAFDRARAPLVYDAQSRRLILKLKHADALHFAQSFAPLMRTAGMDILARADLLIPVPLS